MSELLNCIKNKIDEYAQDAAFIALKSFEADVKFRVNNQGLNSDRKLIGRYQNPHYIDIREEAGRQTRYVDLEFTGKMRRDLTTGTSKGVAVLGYVSKYGKDLHDKHTKTYGRVFSPTTLELRDMEDRFLDHLYDKIRDCSRN